MDASTKSGHPLYVAFLWHMHQPFYKDLSSGEYILPWVYLHGIKDYYDMAAIVDECEEVRVTFNLVPSLLVQLKDYAEGKASDKFWELTKKEAEELSLDDKVFILENFFHANFENMIKPFKRYYELYAMRRRDGDNLERAVQRFKKEDFLDLQVCFNLAWCGNSLKEKDQIVELLRKGRGYSEDNKRVLLELEREIIGKITQIYRRLWDEERIEISTSPFHHPILPLLCDTDSAREGLPQANLPRLKLKRPGDARAQIVEALEFHNRILGKTPSGMWPSEGSISQEVGNIAAGLGIDWMASDDGVLRESLKLSGKSGTPFRMYSFGDGDKSPTPDLIGGGSIGDIKLFFRDHRLSDLIGFVYQTWDAKKAAEDFVGRLLNIRDGIEADSGAHIVSIILDGENAWENYRENGAEFLRALYKKLSNTKGLKTITFNSFLKMHPEGTRLKRIFPGSWIDANFGTWIGDEEENRGWEYLKMAGDELDSLKEDPSRLNRVGSPAVRRAQDEIYIAQGSDWFWWYGADHSSSHDEQFDSLFRGHLKNFYQLIGKEPPGYLDVPLTKVEKRLPFKEPVDFICPVIDGKVTGYYEWLSAGCHSMGGERGSTHRGGTILKNVHYGFDLENLYLRADTTISPDQMRDEGISVAIEVVGKDRLGLDMSLENNNKNFSDIEVGVDKVFEVKVPFDTLGASKGESVGVRIYVVKGGSQMEVWPLHGAMTVEVPGKDFLERMWYV